MQPVPPFWFRQRQGKMEAVGADLYRVTAPNLQEAFVGIRQTESGGWRPVLKLQSDGPELEVPPVELQSRQDAWEAAFELHRQRLVV
jgi:hypothetical protein